MRPSSRVMNTTISTQRQTEADTGGFVSRTWASSLSSIRASVQPASSNEAIQLGVKRNTEAVDIYVDGGQDILEGDRVVHGSRTYSIVRPRDAAGRGDVDHIVGLLIEGVAST